MAKQLKLATYRLLLAPVAYGYFCIWLCFSHKLYPSSPVPNSLLCMESNGNGGKRAIASHQVNFSSSSAEAAACTSNLLLRKRASGLLNLCQLAGDYLITGFSSLWNFFFLATYSQCLSASCEGDEKTTGNTCMVMSI